MIATLPSGPFILLGLCILSAVIGVLGAKALLYLDRESYPEVGPLIRGSLLTSNEHRWIDRQLLIRVRPVLYDYEESGDFA